MKLVYLPQDSFLPLLGRGFPSLIESSHTHAYYPMRSTHLSQV